MAALDQARPSLNEVVETLKERGVFPDVLPYSTAQELKGVLEICYPSGATITAGQKPHRDEVQNEPTVRFHPPEALSPTAHYTLLMADPDLMKRNDPANRQVCHWVQPGLRVARGAAGRVGGVGAASGASAAARASTDADGSALLAPTRAPHTTFLPSAPMPGTGAHRYVFVLAKEPGEGADAARGGETNGKGSIGTGQRGGDADFAERLGFDAVAFLREHGLEVVGAAAMEVAPTAGAGVDDAKLMAESAVHKALG
ncbi:phosphatidylethanolamine-binding protein [Schizophyllum fasciatum]